MNPIVKHLFIENETSFSVLTCPWRPCGFFRTKQVKSFDTIAHFPDSRRSERPATTNPRVTRMPSRIISYRQLFGAKPFFCFYIDTFPSFLDTFILHDLFISYHTSLFFFVFSFFKFLFLFSFISSLPLRFSIFFFFPIVPLLFLFRFSL